MGPLAAKEGSDGLEERQTAADRGPRSSLTIHSCTLPLRQLQSILDKEVPPAISLQVSEFHLGTAAPQVLDLGLPGSNAIPQLKYLMREISSRDAVQLFLLPL